MEELVTYLARCLVDSPDDVRVERVERDGAIVLRLHVASDDLGKVIGQAGPDRPCAADARARQRHEAW